MNTCRVIYVYVQIQRIYMYIYIYIYIYIHIHTYIHTLYTGVSWINPWRRYWATLGVLWMQDLHTYEQVSFFYNLSLTRKWVTETTTYACVYSACLFYITSVWPENEWYRNHDIYMGIFLDVLCMQNLCIGFPCGCASLGYMSF
jgi:hypothetical protein